MIKTEIVTINGRQFVYTHSDDNMMIERDGVEYDEAYDPIDTGRVYTETNHIIETVTEDIEELKQKYTEAVQKYNIAEARAERLDRIKAKITELRDKATLQTTKAIYNAILALFDEED